MTYLLIISNTPMALLMQLLKECQINYMIEVLSLLIVLLLMDHISYV
jgi:hypothetical protein